MTISCAVFVDGVRQGENGIDLCGLSEGFGFPGLPVTLEKMPLFLNLELDDADRGKSCRLEFHLLAPNGQALDSPNWLDFTLPADEDAVTAKLLPTLDLTFHKFGTHTLEIRREDTLLQRLQLTITQQGLRK
ncbi:DUF6941 family protein [Armatimonas sp.]|uniref:DUF6941 family protein n=1 Tax=Armatimonas sp. TaxID=1872638 RepID=UPI00374D1EE1